MVYILVLLTIFYDTSKEPIKDWYLYDNLVQCETEAKEMEQFAHNVDASLMAMCLEIR